MTIKTGWSGYTKSQGKVVVASGIRAQFFSRMQQALQTLCGLRCSWESIYIYRLMMMMMMMMMMVINGYYIMVI